jgi:hypothetical protein
MIDDTFMKASAIFSYSSAFFAENSEPCRTKWRSRAYLCLKGTVHTGRRAYGLPQPDCTLPPTGKGLGRGQYEPSAIFGALYTILYRETVKPSKRANLAHRKINKLLVFNKTRASNPTLTARIESGTYSKIQLNRCVVPRIARWKSPMEEPHVRWPAFADQGLHVSPGSKKSRNLTGRRA